MPLKLTSESSIKEAIDACKNETPIEIFGCTFYVRKVTITTAPPRFEDVAEVEFEEPKLLNMEVKLV